MQRTNYFPNNTPVLYQDFVDYLIATYPLKKTKHLIWEFMNREWCGGNKIGYSYTVEDEGFYYTTCEVAMGSKAKPFDNEKVLLIAAHEYCHAMQYDLGEEGNCVEADAFADQVVPEFLSRVAA